MQNLKIEGEEKMYQIDLNCDLGESFGAYKIGMDEQILPIISSANIACGFHAADPLVMEKTVALAAANGIGIGAHPGFPDLQGFGRREMKLSPAEVRALIVYQIGALSAFVKAVGGKLQHVKSHGALYNMAGKDESLAMAICEGIQVVDEHLIVLGQSGSKMEAAAEKLGLSFAKEVFADRAYEEDGSLVARSKKGAMIEDEEEAVNRVIRMIKEGKVRAVTGKDIAIEADSVCVHGDGEKAVKFVEKIRAALQAEGIEIIPLSGRGKKA